MDFKHLSNLFQKNFASIVHNNDVMLYETDVDKDHLWNLYLDSFPAAKNPLFRVRREYDCSCCRHFMREVGGLVYIKDNTMHSIFEFDTGDPDFQQVFDALKTYVTSRTITGHYVTCNFRIDEAKSADYRIGNGVTRCVEDGKVVQYDHYELIIPRRFVYSGNGATIDTFRGRFRDTRNVFKRSLDEITMDALDTVMELVQSNTLYRGAEWRNDLRDFRERKKYYDKLRSESEKEMYCWAAAPTVGMSVGRIRNHSIGKLLVDISEGMELEAAVRSYEQIVAPANYKRPKAIFTKRMLEDAEKKITELGYMESLPRRFATMDDISIRDIIFCNREAAKRINGAGSVFDQMRQEVASSPKQFSRVEEISIEKFLSDVVPGASSIEAYVENRHRPNMCSVIAPAVKGSKPMFKWGNGFSWAYSGNIADSEIRENVKNAGGNVDGVLRFSIQWNDIDRDANDLDAHCVEPNGNEIYYSSRRSYMTGGNLDIDIINPVPGKPAVENITYPDKKRMMPGKYVFSVHCFSNRGGRSGFRAEIAFDGQVFNYDYSNEVRQSQRVVVAVVTMNKDGTFSIQHELPESVATPLNVWGVSTNSFVPVSVVMLSPNYWGDEEHGVGNKHYMFMLKGCVNDEEPNGFYNEFLKNELVEHKRVLEALGGKMAVAYVDDQLSGLGFSATKRNSLIVKVQGKTERVMKIIF